MIQQFLSCMLIGCCGYENSLNVCLKGLLNLLQLQEPNIYRENSQKDLWLKKKMKSWTLLICLFSAVFSLPLPHAQHPGYINFSYEVMTPLKWYQSLIGHQYPRYSYEPMGGWMHHHTGPHHSPYLGFQQIHPLPHQMHPSQQHLPPMNTPLQPVGHAPFGQMPGQNTMPHYPAGVPVQNPPHAGEHPGHHQQPGNPNHPMQPGGPNQPMYPVHPVQPLPPVIHDAPLEPWPGTDKTKQEEVD